jgi:hypothetical protein
MRLRYAELPLQTLQGAAAQVFSDNPDGIDGWFISTDLGSLIKNDEQAGDGFFLGGEAKQFQTKRAVQIIEAQLLVVMVGLLAVV